MTELRSKSRPVNGKPDDETFEELRASISNVGQISGIVRCMQHPDRVLSGHHRLRAGATRSEYLDVDALAARLGHGHEFVEQLVGTVANIQRGISREERANDLVLLFQSLMKEGSPRDGVANKIRELTGFSLPYIYELVPQIKDPERSEAIKKGIQRKVNPVNIPAANGKEFALDAEGGAAAEPATPLSQPAAAAVPEEVIGQSEGEQRLKRRAVLTDIDDDLPSRENPPDEDQTIRLPVQGASGRGRGTVNVTALTLLYYDIIRAEVKKKLGKDYEGGLPAFLEDCVVGYLKAKGKKVAWVNEID